jgi:hypothetical protein
MMSKHLVVSLAVASIVVAGAVLGRAQQKDAVGTVTAQDFIEIQQLYATLARGLDSGGDNGYAFARVFVPDGVQGRLAGQKALAEFANTWHTERNGANVRHSISNLTVTRSSEGATGSAYLLMLNVGDKPPTIFGTASEDDALVKTADGWRFKSRTIHPDR